MLKIMTKYKRHKNAPRFANRRISYKEYKRRICAELILWRVGTYMQLLNEDDFESMWDRQVDPCSYARGVYKAHNAIETREIERKYETI